MRFRLPKGASMYASKAGNSAFVKKGGKTKILRRTSKGGPWKIFKPKK